MTGTARRQAAAQTDRGCPGQVEKGSLPDLLAPPPGYGRPLTQRRRALRDRGSCCDAGRNFPPGGPN